MTRFATTMAVLVLLAVSAGAEATRVRDVSLFKNGLGYFIEMGMLDPDTTDMTLRVPPAVHGSYWVYAAPSAVPELALRASWEDSVVPRDAATLAELLSANIGRTVELVLKDHSRSGVIVSVPRPVSGVIHPMRRDFIAPLQADYVLIETDGRQEAVLLGEIKQVRSGGMILRSVTDTKTVPALHITYKANRSTPVRVSYLRKGITWAPAYRLDIADSPGWLALSAVVINEATDLESVTLRLISGFPNLVYSDVVSPLAMQGTLADFLNSIGGGGTSATYRRESIMMQSLGNAPAPMAESYMSEERGSYTAAGSGDQAEDLFYYTLNNVSLGMDERASLQALAGPMEFRHLYSWDIVDGGWSPYQQRIDKSIEEIWHFVKFENSFPVPLTTGPILIVSGDRLIAEDMLTYTPSSGTARVRITKAVDISAEREEVEVGRDRQARTIRGSSYDLVTVEGRLKLHNYKSESVAVEISRTVEGEFISSTSKVEAVKIAEALRDVNPRTRLKWEVSVGPGQTTEVAYRYRLFVP